MEVRMPAAGPCKVPIKNSGEIHRSIGKRKTKYACIDADESTRPRLEGAGQTPHQDHITAKRMNSLLVTLDHVTPLTRSKDSSTSFPLADHQSRQDKRTRDALFTRAPPNNKDTRIQQCSATMFDVYLCPTGNTFFCGKGELVSRVHTLVAGVVQVYHRLQVVEEEEKVRKVKQEVEREDQGEEPARMTMQMEMT